MKRKSVLVLIVLIAMVLVGIGAMTARASSHREAPLISEMPKVDGTDFYMFNSYEPGRAGFVTLVADYIPLEDPFGGPNYFELDPAALYEILIDNDGDAQEEITFQFRFTNTRKDIALDINGAKVAIPLINAGPVPGGLNVVETYTVDVVRGDRRTGTKQPITNAKGGGSVFTKPVDNIGEKSIADYAAYAATSVYDINIPGCTTPGSRLFVGQRKDPFVVNLGETFDLINYAHPIALTPADRSQRTGFPRRQERHVVNPGGSRQLPDRGRQASRDRGLDHGEPAPGTGAEPVPGSGQIQGGRRRLHPGFAPGQPLGQRVGDWPQGQGPLQRQPTQG